MPVIDHAVHPKTRHINIKAGCFNRDQNPSDPVPARTFTGEIYYPEKSICRQIGRKFNGAWIPLDECLGCQAEKDEGYITQARMDIDAEARKFMKADQR